VVPNFEIITAPGGLFGAGPAAASAAAPPTAPPAGGLGASTIGHPPDARSRLKNKSMDEILTRWASDLSKHQKEFQRQAKQVQAWDALLVKNTEKISGLYQKTFDAEKDAAEVEKQLTAVEAEQEELEQWLSKYEGEVDEMMRRMGSGLDGAAGGVDLERHRTYQMAEKLTERLDGLNKDLGDVIEEVNGVSGLLSKSAGPDDQVCYSSLSTTQWGVFANLNKQLSQIVKVLNSHLQQLQLIDQNTLQLQAKVDAAKKESKSLNASTGANGWHGVGTDPAEDFYKSFMGRR